MTDPQAGPICAECGDPQSQHKGGTGDCRRCEYGCARFEEVYVPAVHRPTPHLDRLKADLAQMAELRAEAVARVAEVARQRDDLRVGRDQAVERALTLAEENAALRAELAKHVRAVGRLIAERDAALLAPPKADGGRIYDQYAAYQCTTCGGRYRPFHNHPCGPLKPIRVTITYIEGAPPA